MPSPTQNQARRATGRPDANEMLARYQRRMDRNRIKLVSLSGTGAAGHAWTKCLEWQLAWENEILRYRDSNNNGEDEDNDQARV